METRVKSSRGAAFCAASTRSCTGFFLVRFSIIANALSTMPSARVFLPCSLPSVRITLPEVFSPVPPLISLFASRSTTFTLRLPNCALVCLPCEWGILTGDRFTYWAKEGSETLTSPRSYLPKSFTSIQSLPLGLLLSFLDQHLQVHAVDLYNLVAHAGDGAHLATLASAKAVHRNLVVLVNVVDGALARRESRHE